MDINGNTYQTYIRVLEEELLPAMGCTEPVALAYAAAKCRDALGADPQRVLVQASGSLIKNVKSVYVPNTGGLRGIEASVAAGVVAGDASKGLEVINTVAPIQQKAIQRFMEDTYIRVDYLDSPHSFDLIITLWNESDQALVRISGHHTNIVRVERNGKILLDQPLESESADGMADRSVLDMDGIWTFATTCRIQDVQALLDRQIEYNMAIVEEGLRKGYGAGIGAVMLKEYGSDVCNRAAAMAAAGSDARMNGCEMPVVINSGSGNQGITCSVPVIVFARNLGASPEQLYRALVLSNLATIYQKTDIGRLSAFCGVVCAGAAAGAGVAYLKGGGLKEVAHTIVNALAILSGMVCDGAKASCAAKIALAVKAGLLGADMYTHGQQFHDGDGLVTKGVDNTIRNIGRLGREGMRETNKEIIKIMIYQ